ncbi:MAG: RidA family protein [Acidimicrobiia bacterium]
MQRLDPDGVYRPPRGIYSQVIRVQGRTQVHVAGTVSLDQAGQLVGEGDMGAQVRQILEHLGASLSAGGATPADVVRINVYSTDVDRYRAEGLPEVMAFFGETRPVSTTVQVTRLVDPRWLVEIEATAVLEE